MSEKFFKLTNTKHFFRNSLTIFWSFFSATYLLMMTFCNIPAQNLRFADTILGAVLTSIISVILGYYFGGSKGSSDKTDIISNMTNAKPTDQPAAS